MLKSRLILVLSLFFVSLFFGVSFADLPLCGGYPCANFTTGANVTQDGRILGYVLQNPPRLGARLESIGQAQISFTMNGKTLKDTDFANKCVKRGWPFANVTLSDPRFENITIKSKTFVPAGIEDLTATNLPVVMVEINIANGSPQMQSIAVNADIADLVKNTTAPAKVELNVVDASGKRTIMKSDAADIVADSRDHVGTGLVTGIQNDQCFAGWIAPEGWSLTGGTATANLNIPANSEKNIRFVFSHFNGNYYIANQLGSALEVAHYAAANWEKLEAVTAKLDKAVPSTGDAKVDEYARWYMTCGVLMTKHLKDGTTVNMGYTELNQRDSFWTSWMHLAWWPRLDKKMLQESVEWQREDGKIPTTILPLIERNDDIDITTYFILRTHRYVQYHNDMEFAKEMFPSILKAFNFLWSLDKEGLGLPQQQSFWGDWKDVGGIEGRKLSPYAQLLYLAALRETAELAEELGETATAKDLQARLEKGEELVFRADSEGGLFNGQYFIPVWRDESKNHDPRVYQDQVVGIVFDVVPDDVANMMLDALQKNMTKWGPAETYPYWPKSFGYDPGAYHNGGVWPYMSHIHAWALFKMDRKEEAMELIKRVGWGDLEEHGDYMPHEYVHSLTGQHGGPQIQGWNASIFATLQFGFLENSLDNR